MCFAPAGRGERQVEGVRRRARETVYVHVFCVGACGDDARRLGLPRLLVRTQLQTEGHQNGTATPSKENGIIKYMRRKRPAHYLAFGVLFLGFG